MQVGRSDVNSNRNGLDAGGCSLEPPGVASSVAFRPACHKVALRSTSVIWRADPEGPAAAVCPDESPTVSTP